MGNITVLLNRYRDGDASALDEVTALVYAELRAIARRQMGSWKPGMTLSATSLANEAYLILREKEGLEVKDRAHFFAIAAQVMRWHLLNRAKAKRMQKRGGGAAPVPFDERFHGIEAPEGYLEGLDEALRRLRKVDERAAQVAELRYLVGLTVEETAQTLGISPITVKRDWAVARAWLAAELDGTLKAA